MIEKNLSTVHRLSEKCKNEEKYKRLSLSVLTTHQYLHIYRQPAGQSYRTIVRRYMNQRNQKINLFNTFRQIVLETHKNENELEVLKIVKQFRSFIDYQYVQHYYNPLAVPLSLACRGVARIDGHLADINSRIMHIQYNKLAGEQLKEEQFFQVFNKFGAPHILLDLLYTHYVFHRHHSGRCKNDHCSKFVHLCSAILQWYTNNNVTIRFLVTTSPALVMMYMDLLETYRTNMCLVSSLSSSLGIWLLGGNYSGEVSKTFREHHVAQKLMELAMSMPKLRDICTIIYTSRMLCFYENTIEELYQINGAIKFIIRLVQRLFATPIQSSCEKNFLTNHYATGSAVELLEEVSYDLPSDQNGLEALFWETDISTTLVGALRSDQALADLSISRSLCYILAQSTISDREVEKLRKIEGIVELLKQVSLRDGCKDWAEDIIEELEC